jgi:hypothetical protein
VNVKILIHSNMTALLGSKHLIPIVKKRIDDRTELCPLLDYSFHNAQKIEGFKELKFCFRWLVMHF